MPKKSNNQNQQVNQQQVQNVQESTNEVVTNNQQVNTSMNQGQQQSGTFIQDTSRATGPHTDDPNKLHIVAVHKEGRFNTAFQLSDGQVVNLDQAIQLVESDQIEDMNTGVNREGEKFLRSYPDGDSSNNLNNLPRF
ncbi:hypothetical protein HSE3_gp052 [Bacillus phage vB_BceM-HSE3]|nr:hypothetical protein HSE3_gp052 [Bacillus phage vB_BceM-HSE3]